MLFWLLLYFPSLGQKIFHPREKIFSLPSMESFSTREHTDLRRYFGCFCTTLSEKFSVPGMERFLLTIAHKKLTVQSIIGSAGNIQIKVNICDVILVAFVLH